MPVLAGAYARHQQDQNTLICHVRWTKEKDKAKIAILVPVQVAEYEYPHEIPIPEPGGSGPVPLPEDIRNRAISAARQIAMEFVDLPAEETE